MRIALAGAGGFAFILAQELSKSANAVLVLSRQVEFHRRLQVFRLTFLQAHPDFEEAMPDVQLAMVNFANVEELRYALRGVDLVISTISGAEQLNLIDAARRARVRVFVPSEFEGSISHRPAEDPLDRGSHAALALLRQVSQSKPDAMQFTVFSCGLFMERFGPGGLQSYNLGASTGVQNSNDYLVDIGQGACEIIETGPSGRPVQVVLTSVYDVARFVAAAIELGPNNWPREFKMKGDQMIVRDLVATCSNVRGGTYAFPAHGKLQG